MALDMGCGWVILGHSERRHVFKESDEVFINIYQFYFQFYFILKFRHNVQINAKNNKYLARNIMHYMTVYSGGENYSRYLDDGNC